MNVNTPSSSLHATPLDSLPVERSPRHSRDNRETANSSSDEDADDYRTELSPREINIRDETLQSGKRSTSSRDGQADLTKKSKPQPRKHQHNLDLTMIMRTTSKMTTINQRAPKKKHVSTNTYKNNLKNKKRKKSKIRKRQEKAQVHQNKQASTTALARTTRKQQLIFKLVS